MATRRATIRQAMLMTTGFAWLGFAQQTHASPGFDFVCFGDDMTGSIGFDLSWETAFVTMPGREMELPASDASRSSGQFDFSDGEWRFSGFAPEGRLWRDELVIADCFQSKNSLKTMALYDKEPSDWSAYDAPGQASGNIRARPSTLSQTVASFGEPQPVTILENTDQFTDGFFWFRVGWGDGQTGYIWGALLCTNADDSELNMTVRSCN